jgi:hypothetical protein
LNCIHLVFRDAWNTATSRSFDAITQLNKSRSYRAFNLNTSRWTPRAEHLALDIDAERA